MTSLTIANPNLSRLADLAVITCKSPHTRTIYAHALGLYLQSGYGISPLTRENVAQYLSELRTSGVGASTLAQTLSAIKKLADEARIQGVLGEVDANAIQFLKSDRVRGSRTGNWLSLERLAAIYGLPDRTTITGKRDAATLALLAGCGLRREEAAQLNWDRYQERDGRMCLVDILGKGDRIRTVPIPEWARVDIESWRQVLIGLIACSPNSRVLRSRESIRTHDDVSRSISGWCVWAIVVKYARKAGVKLAPHDFRRTLARLLRDAGVPLDEIQHMLGHENIQTTMKYIGMCLELREGKAGVDKIRI